MRNIARDWANWATAEIERALALKAWEHNQAQETPAQDTSLGQSSTVVQAAACVEDKMEWRNCRSLSCEGVPLETTSYDMR